MIWALNPDLSKIFYREVYYFMLAKYIVFIKVKNYDHWNEPAYLNLYIDLDIYNTNKY